MTLFSLWQANVQVSYRGEEIMPRAAYIPVLLGRLDQPASFHLWLYSMLMLLHGASLVSAVAVIECPLIIQDCLPVFLLPTTLSSVED